MWVPRPSSPDSVCDECKRGPDQGVGPFWRGPLRPTGRPGFGRRQMGRVHVCRECMFVVVNHPLSPFHGLIPAGEAAVETAKQADRHVARLRARILELEQPSAAPATVDDLRAAIAELASPASPEGLIEELRAVVAEELARKPAAESKPKPRTAAKPKAA